jgi:hypothetical protein
MYYQNLIERLNWIENRHTTLGESNIVKDIETGFICVGQNWNGETVTETQMEVHIDFMGSNQMKVFIGIGNIPKIQTMRLKNLIRLHTISS